MSDGRNGGGRRKRPIREIPFAEIERDWELGTLTFIRPPSPPVGLDDGGGYYIRVVIGERRVGASTTTTYDYFRVDADGIVSTAPRGYAKDYKPGRITGMDEAVAKYAGGAR